MPPDRYAASSAFQVQHRGHDVPQIYHEALSGPESAQWQAAMEHEIDAVRKMNAWSWPSGHRAVQNRYKPDRFTYGRLIPVQAIRGTGHG